MSHSSLFVLTEALTLTRSMARSIYLDHTTGMACSLKPYGTR